MSKCCAIPGCRSKLRNNVMFSIAENSSLAQWWTTTPWYNEAKDASIWQDLKICSVHFHKDQLDSSQSGLRLVNNVVPSVNLPGSLIISAVHENYTEPSQQAAAACSSLLAVYCRFCGKKQKHPIKNDLEELVESEDLLQLCLGRGRFLEGFPSGVCDNCLQIVKVTTRFIKNCEQAQEKLQKIFFGTAQQMVDSLVEEQEDEQYQDGSFVMPEAIVSLKEEAQEEAHFSDIEFLEVGSHDPLNEGQYVGTDVSRVTVAAGAKERSKSKGEEQDIRCTICDRTFQRKRALNAHMESIHEGRTFSCPICGKSMGWRKTLQRHMKSHEENFQKYKCDQCGKAFSRPSHLRLHMSKHTGQKVRCPICSKGYRDKHKLAAHLMKGHEFDQETAKTYAQQAENW